MAGKIISAAKCEKVTGALAEMERRHERAVRRLEARIEETEANIAKDRRRLDDLKLQMREAQELYGYARIERLTHEVISDCANLIKKLQQGGIAAIRDGIVPFVENHLRFDNRWEELHLTLKKHRMPPREKSLLPQLPKTLDEVWQRLLEIAPSAEIRRTHNAITAYLAIWHTGNRPDEHWKDDAFAVRVDAAWKDFRDTLEPLVEHLRNYAAGNSPKAAPPREVTVSSGQTATDRLLLARGGKSMPYIIDPAKNTITRRSTGKSYRITGPRAIDIVNRLTGGMANGIKGKAKAPCSVAFTDRDARVFRKGRLDDHAAFLRECVGRDPFQGHRTGNRRFADTARLLP